MANDKNFKVKNGLIATRYLQSNGADGAGSVGYDLANASYDSVSFSVNSQDTAPRDVTLKTDGTKLYIIGGAGNDVNEYNLSSAWDITTATYSQNFSLSAQTSYPTGLFFKPDGTKLYITDINSSDFNEYTLSTAWDVSTASYVQNFDTSAQELWPLGISFKPDGTKMYIVGSNTDRVYEYTLSTAWDITTATYSQNFSVLTQTTSPYKVLFELNGTKMFVMASEVDLVLEYTLSTAWDVSTASYTQSFDVSSQETSPLGLSFKSDGTKMYVVGTSNDTIYQYSTALLTQTLDLSTGNTFSFTPSGATTVSFTNPPASGTAVGFSVEINGDGSAITWPSSIKWHLGTAPTATASKELYTFVTTDGGTTYYGKLAAGDIA